MEQNYEMVSCNKAADIKIKRIDADNYFLKLVRIDVNPTAPQHPTRREQIKLFTPQVWKNMQGFGEGKNAINWMRAAGVAEAVVVHDPTLMTESELKAIQEYRDAYLASRRPPSAPAGTLADAVAEIARLKRKLKVR